MMLWPIAVYTSTGTCDHSVDARSGTPDIGRHQSEHQSTRIVPRPDCVERGNSYADNRSTPTSTYGLGHTGYVQNRLGPFRHVEFHRCQRCCRCLKMDDDISADVNILSQYLSRPDVASLSSVGQVDCIVLCVSSVLYSAQTVFDTLVQQPSLTKTLVLCGGLGHSTELVHKAVALHPTFKSIAAEICGLPEAQVLYAIWNSFYASQVDPSAAPRILIEDRSTTCATNATEARKLLEASAPRSIVVIQDPTMVRRTVACFDRVYSDMAQPPTILGCPIFVPRVKCDGTSGQLAYETPPVNEALMWKMDRFLQLVMGEIPRLRDDENGYGPKGNGSIVHVDIPDEVEQAYTRLAGKIAHRR